MAANRVKSKNVRVNGGKAIDTIMGNPPVKAGLPPAWVMTEAVALGVKGAGGYTSAEGMSILNISPGYRRRFTSIEKKTFPEIVFALRLILWTRLMRDFPGCIMTMQIIQPQGDIGVRIEAGEATGYIGNPRVLQKRLDEACELLAGCLGV